jgi:hypothetical protein
MEKCLNPGHSTRLETGPGLQCEVWQPAVAAGCHNVVAHRAAWPGRLDDPQCARVGATGRGGTRGHGSSIARLAWGQG